MKQRNTTSCNNSSKYQLMAKGISNMQQQYQARGDTRAIAGYMNGTGCHNTVEFLSSYFKLRPSVEVPCRKSFVEVIASMQVVNHQKHNCVANNNVWVPDMPPFPLVPRGPLCSHLAERGRTGAKT